METQIIQQIKTLFAGADERNWEKVKSTMNNTVLLDYSSMTGNPAITLSPDDITYAWAAFLPGFDNTHHQLSDFSVSINGNEATAEYYGKADHFISTEVWTVEGAYHTHLLLINGSWLINAQTFNFSQQSGNTALPALATRKMQGQ
ncbi:SnoaL-like protein [Chitinophaga dinghuensis]|uniref:SnoaL-like protein n=1 Tax=Chitinophaga dinghuensis TaxID=1539050 RepID=A0A327VIN0_9BACT|nr:nuclear transport factor 2 family protein [Chitinophaga dinghuensis]RAJ73724.1 SnoaL-like protein [Chitinophaga dinghuensis]